MGDISTQALADCCSIDLPPTQTAHLDKLCEEAEQRDTHLPTSTSIATITPSTTNTTTETLQNLTASMENLAVIPLEVQQDFMSPFPSPTMSDGNEADNEADVSSIASSDYSPPTPKDVESMPRHLLSKPSFTDDAISEIVPFDFTESVAVVISYAYAGKAKLVEVSSGSELSSSSNSPNLSKPSSNTLAKRAMISQKRRLGTLSGPPAPGVRPSPLILDLEPKRFSIQGNEKRGSWLGYDIGDYVQGQDRSPGLAGSKFGEVGLSPTAEIPEPSSVTVAMPDAPPLPERSRNRLSGVFMHPVNTNGSSVSSSPEMAQSETFAFARPQKVFASTITPVTDLTLTSSVSTSSANINNSHATTNIALPSPPPSPFWRTTSSLARKFSLSGHHNHYSSSSLAQKRLSQDSEVTSTSSIGRGSQKRKAMRSGLNLRDHLNLPQLQLQLQLAPHNATNAMAPMNKKLRKRRRVVSGESMMA